MENEKMEKIDLDLLEKIFSSDKNKLISTGFIAGMLSDEIYKDNQLFFYSVKPAF